MYEVLLCEVFTAAVVKSSNFWDVTPYSPLKVNRRFGGTCRLNLQGRRVKQTRNQREAGRKQVLIFSLLRGVISQKMEVFMCKRQFNAMHDQV
jgi:hypothetical protein